MRSDNRAPASPRGARQCELSGSVPTHGLSGEQSASNAEQLRAITEAMAVFLERGDWREASARLLRAALSQTGSEYGFAGAVVDGPTLRILAHEGVSWHPSVNREFYENALRTYRDVGHLEFSNFDNLFGRVITTGRPVVSNAPDADPRSGGRPPGHPPLNSFLGVPMLKGADVVGMIGVANRPGGYSDDERTRLELFAQTAAVLYDGYRRLEREAELEERYRQLVELCPDAIGIHSGGRLVFANPAAARLLGAASPEVIIGRLILDFVHPDDKPSVLERIEQLHAGEPVPLVEERLVRLDGRVVDVEVAAMPFSHGDRPAVQVVIRDISERKRAGKVQAALFQVSEAAASIEEMPAFYAAVHRVVEDLTHARNFYIALVDDSSGLLTFPYFADQADAPPGPLEPGKTLTGYVLRTGQPLLAGPEVFSELVARGEVTTVGSPSVDWLGVPLREGTKTFGVVAVQSYSPDARLTDVDKELLTFVSQHVASAISRRRAQEALAESERGHRRFVENLPERYFFYRHDREGRFTYLSPSVSRVLGYDPEEYRTHYAAMFTGDPINGEALRHTEATLRGELQPSYEVEVRAKDGSVHRLEVTEYPVPGPNGEVGFVEGIAHDITRRREAEKRLAESEQRLRTILDTEPECVKLVDPGGTVLAMNPAGLAMVEVASEEEVVGRSVYDLVCPEHHATFRALNEAVFRGEVRTGEFEIVGRKGTRRWMETHAAPLRDAQGNVFAQLAVTRDVTPRKRAEEALRASEEKYRSFFEENLAGSYVATPEGKILACNPSFARITGFASIQEASQSSLWSLYPDSAAAESFVDALRRQGRVENHQHELRCKDGTPLHVAENAVGRFDRRRELVEIHGYVIDESERRKAEAQFRQAQKMEAVGRLAGGVAHDFNNLLGVIMGYGEILLRRVRQDDASCTAAREVLKAAERAAALTRQLLAFSRKQILEPKVVNLNDVVASTAAMLHRLLGEDIELHAVTAPDLGATKVDAGQMEQVILNLAVNARDAMPDGGRLTLETANVELDAEYAPQHVAIKPGSFVMVAVSDTGTGMDAETRSHIFEPFFTTKDKGKGTGLGLATVYGIVKQSGGYIWVYSEPGRGSTFKIYLPRTDEASQHGRAAPPAAPPRGSETVLLAEDESALRVLMREDLESWGYTVLEAGHGAEALGISERHDGDIHLVVTDVIMPDMNGPDLARRIRLRRPETKVLCVSGFTDDVLVRVLDSGVPFLQKPFRPDVLARKVRSVLDERTVAATDLRPGEGPRGAEVGAT